MTTEEKWAVAWEAQPRLLHYILRKCGQLQEAEDIVQDAYVRLVPQIDTLHTDKVVGFLFNHAKWIWLDGIRRTRRTPLTHLNPELDVESPFPYFDEVEVETDYLSVAQHFPESQRTVLTLVVLGHPISSVANLLDIPLGTAKTRMHWGKKRFREAYAA